MLYNYTYPEQPHHLPIYIADDGKGDYNRSYDQGYDNFDYADYSTDPADNNFMTQQKKKRKTKKEIIEDLLKRP